MTHSHPRAAAKKLRRIALVALHTGKVERAEQAANAAMEISCDYDDHYGIVGALIVQARIADHYGDQEQVEMSVNEARRWIRIHIAPLLHHH